MMTDREFSSFMGSIGLSDSEAEALDNDTANPEWMQVIAQRAHAAAWQHQAEQEHARAEKWKAKAWDARGFAVTLGALCVLQQIVIWVTR